jgi:hypothetical protein
MSVTLSMRSAPKSLSSQADTSVVYLRQARQRCRFLLSKQRKKEWR